MKLTCLLTRLVALTFLFCLGIQSAFAANSGSNSKDPAWNHSQGALMNLDFTQLEPGQVYQVDLEKGWFTDYIEQTPQDFKIHNHHQSITFHAPKTQAPGSQFAEVHFAIGSVLDVSTAPFKMTVDIPQPAIAKLSISRYGISHTFTHDANVGTQVQPSIVSTSIAIPELHDLHGCLPRALITCSTDPHPLDGFKCPVNPDEPFKCYGPLRATMYCCTSNPY